MKKAWIFIVVAISVVIGVIVLYFCRTTITLDSVCGGRILCGDNDKIISTEITLEDAQQIAALIDGHHYYQDAPSCGFSQNAAIELYTKEVVYSFYIASDGCPVLYDSAKRQYLKLKEDEIIVLHGILSAYGMNIPCV